MKRTIIAALASLMLAGALSAISAAIPADADGTPILVGDGGSPAPLLSPYASGERATSPEE